jgi:RNA polymerase sigma-70 factor (ECF subfamily)
MAARRQCSDVELLSRSLSEPEAFGELYRRHEQVVLGYFLHWSRSPELAADLTAETFAAAFGSLAGYRADRGEPRAWLFGIARHVLARSIERGRVENEARRRLGMPPLVVDDHALERIEEVASLDGAVVEWLGELAAPTREAVAGRVLDERSYSELAQALACSESVVRQRVKRGLARLRNRMEVSS